MTITHSLFSNNGTNPRNIPFIGLRLLGAAADPIFKLFSDGNVNTPKGDVAFQTDLDNKIRWVSNDRGSAIVLNIANAGNFAMAFAKSTGPEDGSGPGAEHIATFFYPVTFAQVPIPLGLSTWDATGEHRNEQAWWNNIFQDHAEVRIDGGPDGAWWTLGGFISSENPSG